MSAAAAILMRDLSRSFASHFAAAAADDDDDDDDAVADDDDDDDDADDADAKMYRIKLW